VCCSWLVMSFVRVCVRSTLLDILASRKNMNQVTGSLLVNGKPPDETFNRIAGYGTADELQMRVLSRACDVSGSWY